MKYKMPKSQRDKKRYIMVRLISHEKFIEEEARRALWQSLLAFKGEHGAAKSRVWMSSWDTDTGIGIIRCAITSVDDVIVALKLIPNIRKEAVNFIVLGVSGTIESLKPLLN
ncbi:MAG: Rpp14/Pop5 family protein [Candidatus Methanofastidiosia archaeon]